MEERSTSSLEWRSLAGELCLDFANTARWHASPQPNETLGTFDDFVRWCRRAHLLDGPGAGAMLREARHRPAAAKAALRRVIAAREVLYRVVVALLQGERPRGADVAAFNGALRSALIRVHLAPSEGGLAWTWERDPHRLDSMLWPILDSAADLLTSDRRTRIRQCGDDRGCGWLFVDATKNRSRRWCDMDDCGNRAKVRRHRDRRNGQGGCLRTGAPKPTRREGGAI